VIDNDVGYHIMVVDDDGSALKALRQALEIPVLLSKPWFSAELLVHVASALGHQYAEQS